MNEVIGGQDFDEDKDPFLCDWKRVRGLIEHEDDLIDQRTRWLTTINAVLFAGFYTIPGAHVDDDLKLFASWALPAIGLIVSIAAKIAISQAMRQLKRAAEWWDERKKSDPRNSAKSPDDALDLRHPPIVGLSGTGQWSHDFMIADVLPATAISLWILMLAGQLWKFLQLKPSLPQLTIWQWILVVVGLALIYWAWSKVLKKWSAERKATPS
jgi:protein-S-isoprenylcysteine O-methyltransferase Ste14